MWYLLITIFLLGQSPITKVSGPYITEGLCEQEQVRQMLRLDTVAHAKSQCELRL